MDFEQAGMAIERIATSYGMADKRAAYKRAIAEHPRLAAIYNRSTSDAPTANSYGMSASDQAMAVARVDYDGNKQKAGMVLGHHAMELAGSNQRGAPNQVSPERYNAAMQELMAAFPDLAECYNSGRVDPDNWALLSTLIPGLSSEIKNRHGVDG